MLVAPVTTTALGSSSGALPRTTATAGRILARLIGPLVSDRRARRAVRPLGALDDHLLADIGLRREQVMAAVGRGISHRGIGL